MSTNLEPFTCAVCGKTCPTDQPIYGVPMPHGWDAICSDACLHQHGGQMHNKSFDDLPDVEVTLRGTWE